MPPSDLPALLERAKAVTMTAAEQEEQRRSFAFGNTTLANAHVTRRLVDDAAEALDARRRV